VAFTRPRNPSLQAPPKVTRKNRIVLGEFDNKTGDPVFDGILREGLSVRPATPWRDGSQPACQQQVRKERRNQRDNHHLNALAEALAA
jgi:hypothetical protein